MMRQSIFWVGLGLPLLDQWRLSKGQTLGMSSHLGLVLIRRSNHLIADTCSMYVCRLRTSRNLTFSLFLLASKHQYVCNFSLVLDYFLL